MTTIHIDQKDPALLAVFFPEDPIGNDLIRSVPGRRWSYSRKCWLVPNSRESIVKLGQLFGKAYCRFDEAVVRLYKPAATQAEVEQATNPAWPPAGWPPLSKRKIATPGLPDRQKPFRYTPPNREHDHHPVVRAVSNALRIQQYSYKTFKNYKQALITLIRYAGAKPLHELTKPAYQKYLLFLVEKKQYQSATLNVHINAWKFYQEKVLKRDKTFYDIDYSRMPTKLPTVYSVAEVKAIFAATTSLKYRTLFRLVYGTGMRLSEVAHLRLTDLDRNRRLITIRAGKGKKDRVVMLSDTMEADMSEYLTAYKTKTYLFEEVEHAEPLAIRTIQRVYSAAVRRAGILKTGGIHTLRHSFATHSLESGMDIRYIQELLGHESILTTMRYTHVAANKISTLKSPLDDL